MARLRKAVAVTVNEADAVLRASVDIAELSAARTKASLVRSLLEDEVVSGLHGLLQTEEAGVALRAHVQWLHQHLALEPIYELGQVLTIPKNRTSSFHFNDAPADNAREIFSIRVLAVGWKHSGVIVRKPVAVVIHD
jgi:hypothetical protein